MHCKEYDSTLQIIYYSSPTRIVCSIMSEYSGFLPIISLIDLDNIYRESHCKSPANYARCMLRISYILSFKMRELAS